MANRLVDKILNPGMRQTLKDTSRVACGQWIRASRWWVWFLAITGCCMFWAIACVFFFWFAQPAASPWGVEGGSGHGPPRTPPPKNQDNNTLAWVSGVLWPFNLSIWCDGDPFWRVVIWEIFHHGWSKLTKLFMEMMPLWTMVWCSGFLFVWPDYKHRVPHFAKEGLMMFPMNVIRSCTLF